MDSPRMSDIQSSSSPNSCSSVKRKIERAASRPRPFIHQQSFASTRQFAQNDDTIGNPSRPSVRLIDRSTVQKTTTTTTVHRQSSSQKRARGQSLIRRKISVTDWVKSVRKGSLETRKSSLINAITLNRAKTTIRKISTLAINEITPRKFIKGIILCIFE